MSTSSLKTIYYALFHSLMTYGIIFWGNSLLGATVFCLQKKAIRIMEDVEIGFCAETYLGNSIFCH
jgi:hypothetical protein